MTMAKIKKIDKQQELARLQGKWSAYSCEWEHKLVKLLGKLSVSTEVCTPHQPEIPFLGMFQTEMLP